MFKVVHPLSRLRSGLTGTLALTLSAFALTACIVTAEQSIEGNPKDPRAQDIADKIKSIDLLPRQTAETGASGIKQQGASRPAIYLSDGTTPSGSALLEREAAAGGGYDLNFENAPVATVAKVILGDVLNVGYTIDPRVQGTVTLASVRPIAKADALYVLENALRMSGVALVRDRSGYRLLPSAEAGPGGIDRAGSAEAGQGISVVPLRYVSAQTVFKLLDAFGVKASTTRPDNGRNTLIISGSGSGPRRRDRHHPELRRRLDEGTIRRHLPGAQLLAGTADCRARKDHGYRRRRPQPERGQVPVDRPAQFHPRGQPEAGIPQARRHLDRAARQVRHRRRQPEGLSAALRELEADRRAAQRHAARTGSASGPLDSASSQISPGAGVSVSSSGGAVAALSGLPTAARRRRHTGHRHRHARCPARAERGPGQFAQRCCGCRHQIGRGRRPPAECPDHGRRHQQLGAGLCERGIAAHRRADHPPDRPAAAPDRDRGDDRRSDAERSVELRRAVFPGEQEGLDVAARYRASTAPAPTRSNRPAMPSTPPPARCSAARCPASIF